jgi:hypothetical protein
VRTSRDLDQLRNSCPSVVEDSANTALESHVVIVIVVASVSPTSPPSRAQAKKAIVLRVRSERCVSVPRVGAERRPGRNTIGEARAAERRAPDARPRDCSMTRKKVRSIVDGQ